MISIGHARNLCRIFVGLKGDSDEKAIQLLEPFGGTTMQLIFEKIINAESNRVIAVAEDGFLRQFTFDPENVRHLWGRSSWPGNSLYKFIPRASGPHRVIDAVGGQLAQHDRLQIYPEHGNQNQRWKIESTGDRETYFIKADTTNLVWDVPYSSHNDGVPIQLYPLNGNDNQKWRILDSRLNLLNVVKIRPEFNNSSGGRALVLDVPGFTQDNGRQIQLYNDNGGYNQLWELKQTPSGTQIVSVCSGKVLSYPLQAAQDNQPGFIIQSNNNDGLNQKWQFNELGKDLNGNRKVNIVSASNGFFLTHFDSGVLAFPDSGGLYNQQWSLID